MNNNPHIDWRLILFGLALTLVLGSGVYAASNGEWCIAFQSWGMVVGWWAFWDRLIRVDCQLGAANQTLREINGMPMADERVPDEDELFIPPPPPSSECPAETGGAPP